MKEQYLKATSLAPLSLPTLPKTSMSVVALPKGTPAWVLDEFARHPELSTYPELVQALNSDMVTTRTWSDIAKYERRRREAKGVSHEVSSAPSLLRPLAIWLRRGLSEFRGEVRLTDEERRGIVKRIKEASGKLADELKRFKNTEDYQDWYFSLHDALDGEDAADNGLSRYATRKTIVEDFVPLLGALHSAATAWETPRRAWVDKPNKATAHRTFFVRTLARGFNRLYGKTLPTATWQFTSVFFRTEKLAVSGVIRLLKTERYPDPVMVRRNKGKTV